ncbi:MAG: type I DNA topoisomerase [Paludibaculum sp.]
MGKALVIVESPAKAKTINKYLGSAYVVKSSFGHIRDLPTSGEEQSADGEKEKKKPEAKPKVKKKATPAAKAARAQAALIRRMGVDPEHGWEAHYEVLPGKQKVLDELRGYAEKADEIYLATDLDREGEAIAWHLREAIGGDLKRYKRVKFAEITKKAIIESFDKAGKLDMDRVNAQQARRFLDRVVGYMVSPLLWQKVARGLSAGRVQSVAVRLVVEREREVRAFIPDEYWELHADLSTPDPLRVQAVKFKGEAFKPTTKAHADTAVAALAKASYVVAAKDEKSQRSNPSAPLITSSLQGAASVRLGFSVKKTMTLAQRLYEAGHITYMRTDSTNLSADAVAACRTLVESEFGPKYVPEKPNTYASKAGAQEAHEAIRPTDVRLRPEELTNLETDQVRLYDLIWRQFVACQMTPAEFDTTTITVQAGDYELRANGRVMRFDGWQKVLPPAKSDAAVLPVLSAGQKLALVKLDPSQHFTKPPARFSEASLVKELEKRGIGRPSTYASIISTIQDRGYVKLANRRFYAEKLGEIVTDRLKEGFTDLMDYGFTASMEEDLDEVAEAKEDWKHLLDVFYKGFKDKLEAAKDGMRANTPVETAISCPKCGRPMAVRTARTGVFLSCTGYGLPPKERCTGTINLVPGEEAVSAGGEDEEATAADVAALQAKKRCPKCSTVMDSYLVDEKRKLHICGNNPDCPGTAIEEGQFKIKGYEGPVIDCDKCGAQMQLRTGRFGKYFGCTRYPECTNTRKLLRSGQAAPPKTPPVPMPELACTKGPGHFVLRDGAVGLFLAASTYPRVRETRAPRVDDLVRHEAELDPKWAYLAKAPAKDPDGNPTILRFSRKTAEHYVSSEKDGEPTGWTSWLVDGRWTPKKAEADDEKPKRKTRTFTKK